MNTKIALSGLSIMASLALIGGAAFAFFSDTETSTGNTFTAGAIDLLVDNQSYIQNTAGDLVSSPGTSWQLDDLTGHLFFNFSDLKPGDLGEDTISLHVNNNDAWLCAAAQITDNSDQTCTEPELVDDNSCIPPGLNEGDLAGQVEFAFWADDGDNVFEQGETTFLEGPISDLGSAGQIALADSAGGALGLGGNNPALGGSDYYIGKAWCFGALTPSEPPIPEDAETSPIDRGTGFDCDGTGVDNASQTDRVMGDIQFYAVQSRNNPDFTCGGDYEPVFPSPDPSFTPSPIPVPTP